MKKVILTILFISLISSIAFSEATRKLQLNRASDGGPIMNKDGAFGAEWIYVYYNNRGVEVARERENDCVLLSGSIPDGKVIQYDDETKKSRLELNYKDGKAEGEVRTYDKDGELQYTYNLLHNKMNGLSVWYNKGRIWDESIWENGDVVSRLHYDDNGKAKGKLTASYTYKYRYRVNGTKQEEITYNNGKLETRRIYGANGWFINCTQGYKNDRLDFENFYNEDGTGENIIYKSDGTCETKQYDEKRNLKAEATYKDGKLDGVEKQYYENGKIQEEDNYKNGKRNGLSKIYYKNGEISSIDTYKNDVKINSKKYDELGKEILNQDYPYEPVISDDTTMQGLSDTIITSFFKTNKFTVLERSKMKEILKEQKFQLTGCTKNECAVEIGKILNVKYMVIGSIAKIGKEYTVNIRIVSVESSEVVIADMEKCDTEKDLIDTIKKVVESISGKKAFSEDSKQNTIAILDLETKKE